VNILLYFLFKLIRKLSSAKHKRHKFACNRLFPSVELCFIAVSEVLVCIIKV